MFKTANLFSSVPASLPDELTQTLVQAKNVRIEQIVSHGHASPLDFWYDSPENEFVLLIQGAAQLHFEGSQVDLKAGDWLNIAAHTKHRVEWTTCDEPTIWLAVYYGDQR